MTPADELKLLLHKHRWAFNELVYDCKMKQANQLTSSRPERFKDREEEVYTKKEIAAVNLIRGPVGDMYQFLREELGGGKQVLNSVRYLVTHQKGPRKTLHLRSLYDDGSRAKAPNTKSTR